MRRPCMSVNATTTVSISPPATDCARCSFVSNQSVQSISCLRPKGRGLPVLRIVAAGFSSSGDKPLEEFARPGQVGGELLRVALHRDDQAIVRLDALDGAVLAL